MLLTLVHAPLMRLATPVLRRVLRQRLARGKEDAARVAERWGVASRPRPAGRLYWVHGASVGEALSALPLIQALLAEDPSLSILVTTGTVSSAQMMAERLPPRAFHQFVPLDHPAWARRFLDHWRPDGVIWLESEFWPGLLGAVRSRRLPAALVNGRLSARSARRWRRLGPVIRPMLDTFGLILMQDQAGVHAMARLGADRAQCLGNLKYSAPPPAADPPLVACLSRALAGRRCVLALSTHPGEEEALLATSALSALPADTALLLIPRHPERGEAILTQALAAGRPLARWDDPDACTAPALLLDRLGAVGSALQLASVALIGGSFIPHGGHNPIEPAQAGVPLLYGPSMENFAAVAQALEAEQAALACGSVAEAMAAARHLLMAPANAQAQAARARAVVARHTATAQRVAEAVTPLFRGDP